MCRVHCWRIAVIISLRLGTFSLVERVIGAFGATLPGTFRVFPDPPELPAACGVPSCGPSRSPTSDTLSEGLTGTINRTRPSSPVAASVPLCDNGFINGIPSSELLSLESLDEESGLSGVSGLKRELSDWPTLIAAAMFPEWPGSLNTPWFSRLCRSALL